MDSDVPGLDVQTVTSGGGCLVTVRGDIDAVTAPDLGRHLMAVFGRSGAAEVDLDLTRVTFLDSAGLTTLVIAHRTAQRAGRVLRMRCGTNRCVLRPLQITGLSTVFPIVDG